MSTLTWANNNDVIIGTSSNDVIDGGNGDDALDGGNGKDILNEIIIGLTVFRKSYIIMTLALPAGTNNAMILFNHATYSILASDLPIGIGGGGDVSNGVILLLEEELGISTGGGGNLSPSTHP